MPLQFLKEQVSGVEGVFVTRRSPVTMKLNRKLINCTMEQLTDWERGKHIQDAMPQVSADDREFIVSGCTKEDWDKLFPPEEG
jgi:hypothetical protein